MNEMVQLIYCENEYSLSRSLVRDILYSVFSKTRIVFPV